MEQAPILRVRDLTKTFTMHVLGGKRVEALNGVSFDVSPGQCVALVGGSGAGKSSLLKCIYRTYTATGGAIAFKTASGDTVDMASADERKVLEVRRDEIRYVPQFLRAQPRMAAVDVVAMPHASNGRLEEVRKDAGAMLSFLGIQPELQSSYPSVFSGGEQQRVNVARALLRPRRLLLLDEPTSALDAGNRERVLDLLSAARRDGAAMIAIIHDIHVLQALADHVLVLDNGRAAEFGPLGRVDAARYVGGQP